MRRLVLICLVPLAAWSQGFGTFSKKEVTVKRLLPPTVNLSRKKIRVDARLEGKIKDAGELPSLLKTKLTVMIQKDPRFIIDEAHPETILRFAITNYYTELYNSPAAGNQPASSAYRGKIEVAYQAVAASTGKPLDSENLSHTAGYDLGNSEASHLLKGIPIPRRSSKSEKNSRAASRSVNETRDQLVDEIVFQMGKRVAPVEEPFEALLPAKKLEPISALAQNHRWGTLQEQAEKFDKFPKPEEDSYRVYLIALAEEAQAYELTIEANERELGKRPDISARDAAAEFRRAQQFMDEARKHYRDIVEANPKEKVFREGDARTEQALAIYSRILRYQEEYLNAQKSGAPASKPIQTQQQAVPAPAVSGKAIGQPAGASNRVSPFEQVLNFCKQGVDLGSINEYLSSKEFLDDAKATNYKFNFSTDTLALKEACKDGAPALQKRIRERLNSTPAGPVRRPATAPQAAPKKQ